MWCQRVVVVQELICKSKSKTKKKNHSIIYYGFSYLKPNRFEQNPFKGTLHFLDVNNSTESSLQEQNIKESQDRANTSLK